MAAITPTVEQLKALTHPVRVRMLGMLRIDGPATATMLAARLGLNTGATSYHLRQLAQHGFIEDDPTRGNGRERWWRAAHTATYARSEALAEGGEEALGAYMQTVVSTYFGRAQEALEERPLLPEAWRRTQEFSDWTARLTLAQIRRLRQQMGQLFEAVDDDPDGEVYVFQLNAYPLPGRLAEDPASAGEAES